MAYFGGYSFNKLVNRAKVNMHTAAMSEGSQLMPKTYMHRYIYLHTMIIHTDIYIQMQIDIISYTYTYTYIETHEA